jgi:hypothetical protein
LGIASSGVWQTWRHRQRRETALAALPGAQEPAAGFGFGFGLSAAVFGFAAAALFGFAGAAAFAFAGAETFGFAGVATFALAVVFPLAGTGGASGSS